MEYKKRRTIHSNGDVYELDGIYHRANGPAIVWDNGDWKWYLNGLKHRYYGPAISGDIKLWMRHGNIILTQ